MGIYINNIEMPKGHNHLTINIWPNGTTSYGVFNREENLCTFKETKAISVPPHGDLIDRSCLCDDSIGGDYGSGIRVYYAYEVEHAPVIIQAEEE